MSLHPGAWWVWALCLAAVAGRSTNPLLLALVIAVAGYVAVSCRDDSPWASAYGVFLKFALVVLAVRVVLHVLLGGVSGPTVLVTLPEIPLPEWAKGIRLGGPVSAEGLAFAVYQGLQLATLLCCVGAANALANAKRLLRSLPAALYEVSVAVVVALTVAPQLVASARSVRRARALRGDVVRGVKAMRLLMVPVLEDAFERSLVLAAAMDSRGYGRTAGLPKRARVLTGALVLGGLLGLCVGAYGLLGGGTPAIEMLVAGAVAAVAGLWTGSRRVRRSRYRPDRWGSRELLIVASGVVAALATFLAPRGWGGSALTPSTVPLTVPELPLLPAIGLLCALAPVVIARNRVNT
ncbi:energy-coupling factor transporter transmembrane protein EcfT [Saccharothrix sp. S26]|uniref:energy-coupling factor transporter transmembrane protein EcfT n=1 Tax=Saccharothrix sp. S26 TaxID=2907215 RepID=UPI001F3B0C94|nr:energy-coupling factor transporter transmembrane protein EcfT [Saccharothrix sp. S26]MCE6997466.1 energy-coupling factor transporter transmembrane protein EcfT [Saccharothrix sp. S26]